MDRFCLTMGLFPAQGHDYPFVPSAARQPALSVGLCAEVSTGIGPMHGRQTVNPKVVA